MMSKLTIHMRIYTGEKLFSCSECGAAFLQKFNLKSHTMTHCPDRPHQCPECNLAFKQKNNLTAHMLKKHSYLVTPNSLRAGGEGSRGNNRDGGGGDESLAAAAAATNHMQSRGSLVSLDAVSAATIVEPIIQINETTGGSGMGVLGLRESGGSARDGSNIFMQQHSSFSGPLSSDP